MSTLKDTGLQSKLVKFKSNLAKSYLFMMAWLFLISVSLNFENCNFPASYGQILRSTPRKIVRRQKKLARRNGHPLKKRGMISLENLKLFPQGNFRTFTWNIIFPWQNPFFIARATYLSIRFLSTNLFSREKKTTSLQNHFKNVQYWTSFWTRYKRIYAKLALLIYSMFRTTANLYPAVFVLKAEIPKLTSHRKYFYHWLTLPRPYFIAVVSVE